ncbi:hypothetical protein [Curtobacterium sp. MCBD17_040]|uniref:hypothetical protein n=1 Tax=Curtobacterium sp. MCBD17_040 TaxID=2175674 RepID=UPI000DAAAAFD|nr:hypothetical protein [Curtobacterium sp. MCBD17_040]WIB65638.1 hypothetical protein DEI94_16085 [Curtobacterium sp. MCBD17_040]
MTNRRPYLSAPGDSLILPPSSFALNTMYESFVADARIEPDRLAYVPLVGSPLPIQDYARGPQGWDPEMNPAVFWHPLLWLPESIAAPRIFDTEDTDDGPEVESVEFWSLRVAWEAVWSGMYDAEDGTWIDVLDLYGLNIDDPSVQSRVQAWLGGAADPVLDTIDLTDYVSPTQDVTITTVADQLDTFRPAGWGVHANELFHGVTEVAGSAQDADTFRWAVGQFAYVALLALGDVPPNEEGGPVLADAWQTIMAEAGDPATPVETLRARAQYLRQSFQALTATFYPLYEDLMTRIANDELPLGRPTV